MTPFARYNSPKMLYYLVKLVISAVLIVAISEIAKRNVFIGALLASIPLTSVLAMLWLYAETKDAAKVAALTTGIFWLVLPSLVLFIALPALLKHGVNFHAGLALSIALTGGAYWLTARLLAFFGDRL